MDARSRRSSGWSWFPLRPHVRRHPAGPHSFRFGVRCSVHRWIPGTHRHRVQGAPVAAGGHAGRHRLHRMGVHHAGGRGPLEARERHLALGAAHPKAGQFDLTTPKRDPARRTPPSPCTAMPTMMPLRATPRFSIRFHHRPQHLLAGADAPLVERLTGVSQGPQHRQRHLDRDRLLQPGLAFRPALAMLRNGGFSFVGSHPCPTTGQVKELPPLSDQDSTAYGTSPTSPALGFSGPDLGSRTPIRTESMTTSPPKR